MKINRYIKLFFIAIIALIFTFSDSYSQIKKTKRTKFKPPVVTFEILAVYNQPLPNLYGNVADFITFNNYGVKVGWGGQVNVKLSADKKGTIRPYLTLGYAGFYWRDNNTAFIDSNAIRYGFPPPASLRYGTTDGKSKIFLHNFNSGLGIEYAFVNKTRFTPHLALDADVNVIFGKYKQSTWSVPNPSDPIGEVDFTIKPAVRLGISAGAGIHLRVSRVVGLVFSSKYKFANILGKNSQWVGDYNKMDILDKKATYLHSMLDNDRHINYLEFGLGIALYAGRR